MTARGGVLGRSEGDRGTHRPRGHEAATGSDLATSHNLRANRNEEMGASSIIHE